MLPGPEMDSLIGAITVATGISGMPLHATPCADQNALVGAQRPRCAGTLAGGALLDRIGSTVPNALGLCAAYCVTACAPSPELLEAPLKLLARRFVH